MEEKTDKTSDDSRMIDRQVRKDDLLDEEEIRNASFDLQSGIDELQSHSLKFMIECLESDKGYYVFNEFAKYFTDGNDPIVYLKDISQRDTEDEDDEITSLAVIFISLCCKYINISDISEPNYIIFLIENKLTKSIPETNAVLSILSDIVQDDENSIDIIIKQGLFDIIPDLPQETEYGELVNIILQQQAGEFSEIESVISILPLMLESPNHNNVCHGLECMGTLISSEYEDFNFEEFHPSFPQFLQSDDELISATAFSLLERIQPNEEDINAVFECLADEGANGLKAIKYLLKSQDLWIDNMTANLYKNLLTCIPKLKFNDIELALELLLVSLNAPDIECDSDQIEFLSSFLSDKRTAKYVVQALSIFWEKIQMLESTDWFFEEIEKYEHDIEEMASGSDEEVSSAASKLLDILS